MKLEIDIKYMMLGKKSEAPVGIKPMTFHIPRGRSNHDWVMGNSRGEQVAGVGVATGLHIFEEYIGLK